MSKRNQGKRESNRTNRRERRLRIRSIRREPVDLNKLAGALIELAEAETEADAHAEQARRQAVRQRKAERAEREQGQAGGAPAARRPRDNRPPGRPAEGTA